VRWRVLSCPASVITGDALVWKLTVHSDAAQGKYDFKLLAVDVPTAAGSDQRLYLAGDDRIYQRGSIIAELRDPFLQVRSKLSSSHVATMSSCVDAPALQTMAALHARVTECLPTAGLQPCDVTCCVCPSQALQMQRVYEEEDEADDAQDEADEELERRRREMDKTAAKPKPMDQVRDRSLTMSATLPCRHTL
jgi:hypothetical protein